MEIKPEQKIQKCCKRIREEIAFWKYINQYGCNDPFWPDGTNMNLVRNHVFSYQMELQKICTENQLPLPEEYYLSLPPEVDNNYMANLKQKDRAERVFFLQSEKAVRKKYVYDEQQMSLF